MAGQTPQGGRTHARIGRIPGLAFWTLDSQAGKEPRRLSLVGRARLFAPDIPAWLSGNDGAVARPTGLAERVERRERVKKPR